MPGLIVRQSFDLIAPARILVALPKRQTVIASHAQQPARVAFFRACHVYAGGEGTGGRPSMQSWGRSFWQMTLNCRNHAVAIFA